jgi:hypothetical protein
MDTVLIDRLLRDAEALAGEATTLLPETGRGPRRGTPAALADTAAGTRAVLLLMDTVAWLNDCRCGQAPDAPDRSRDVKVPAAVVGSVEPRLADLLERVEKLHARLRRLAGQRGGDEHLLAPGVRSDPRCATFGIVNPEPSLV